MLDLFIKKSDYIKIVDFEGSKRIKIAIFDEDKNLVLGITLISMLNIEKIYKENLIKKYSI